MDKYNRDTLANLISHELHELQLHLNYAKAQESKSADYWEKELSDLKQLDSVIWDSIR